MQESADTTAMVPEPRVEMSDAVERPIPIAEDDWQEYAEKLKRRAKGAKDGVGEGSEGSRAKEKNYNIMEGCQPTTNVRMSGTSDGNPTNK